MENREDVNMTPQDYEKHMNPNFIFSYNNYMKFKSMIDPTFILGCSHLVDFRITGVKKMIRKDDGSLECNVDSLFIILDELSHDDVFDGFKQPGRAFKALLAHKELRKIVLNSRFGGKGKINYNTSIKVPYKPLNGLLVNQYMHIGIDDKGCIYIYIGKDFDTDKYIDKFREFMR